MSTTGTLASKEQVNEFHETLRQLLKHASSLVSAQELCDRLDMGGATDRDMRYFRRRYHNNMNDLDRTISQYLKTCIEEIQKLDEMCREAGLLEGTDASDPSLVLRLLSNSERRSKYRRLSQYHRLQEEILTLKQMENEFRRLPKSV